MTFELRPDKRRRRKPEDPARRAALVEEYYRLVSTHPSYLVVQRPSSAAANPVPSAEPALPAVLRASTPFESMRAVSRVDGRPPPPPSSSSPQALIPSFTDEADPPLADLQTSVRPPSALMPGRFLLPSSPTPGGRLVCVVRDQPVSYFSSPLRRAASRLKLSTRQRLSVSSPMPSPSSLPPPTSEPTVRKPTTTERLNSLLRCSSPSRL